MKHIKPIIMILFSTFLFQHCSDKDPHTISYNGNVKEIMNYKPLYGDEEVYSLELQNVYGGPDDKEAILGKPSDLVKDREGNIFIFDESDMNIKKYDKDWNFIATFGQKGNGPGEFQNFFSMQIDEEDNIFIYDMLGRLQKISNMGQYINEYRLPMFILWFTIMSPEKILFSKVLDEVDGYKTDILHMSNYNGDIAFSFCKLEEFSELPMTKTFNITFGVKDNTNNVIVTFYSQNRIEKYNQNGKLIFRAKRKLNYDIFINEKREKVIGISGEKFKIPNYECSYVSSGIGIDYENNIWIITLIKQPSKEDLRTNTIEFEVYNSDGILITRVPIPEIYFDNFKIFDDDIFFLDSHETGAVYEYKIIKK